MKILITGGTGFIGTAITQRLIREQHDVVLLTRGVASTNTSSPQLRYVQWDGVTLGEWAKEVNHADAVINMAGEVIAGKRWSPAQKRKIVESRMNATRAIVEAIQQATRKPSVLISASAVGYYGNVQDGDVTETSAKGEGFLADVCDQWEQSATRASAFNVRVVLPRIGIVLEKTGGALPKLLIPFRFGIGGWMGSGRQWFPWIHRDDVVNAIIFSIANQHIEGPLNLAAPESVTMKSFSGIMGKTLHRPSWVPAPSVLLKLALGEMADTILTGQKAIPKKLLDNGYRFLYPNLDVALHSILKGS